MAIISLKKPSIGLPRSEDQAHSAMFARNTINYGTDTDATVFNIPAGTIITDAFVNVKTHFDGSSPTLTIGTSDSATAFFASSDVNLADTGASRAVGVDGGSAGFPFGGKYFSSAKNVIIALNPDSSTAGEAEIIMNYISPPNTYPA